MEIQLKLRGNSEGFILESKLPDDELWTERIEIVQEDEGYRLYAKDVEILVLKVSEYISKKKRIVARGLNKDLIYYEEKRFEHLWEQAYWHGVFQFNLNNYEMTCVGSGSKGDISPVKKMAFRLPFMLQVILQLLERETFLSILKILTKLTIY